MELLYIIDIEIWIMCQCLNFSKSENKMHLLKYVEIEISKTCLKMLNVFSFNKYVVAVVVPNCEYGNHIKVL